MRRRYLRSGAPGKSLSLGLFCEGIFGAAGSSSRASRLLREPPPPSPTPQSEGGYARRCVRSWEAVVRQPRAKTRTRLGGEHTGEQQPQSGEQKCVYGRACDRARQTDSDWRFIAVPPSPSGHRVVGACCVCARASERSSGSLTLDVRFSPRGSSPPFLRLS